MESSLVLLLFLLYVKCLKRISRSSLAPRVLQKSSLRKSSYLGLVGAVTGRSNIQILGPSTRFACEAYVNLDYDQPQTRPPHH